MIRELVHNDHLPDYRVALEDERNASGGDESKTGESASLFSEPQLSGHERLVFDVLRQDEAVQLDDVIERLEAEMGSAEIFTALFELELSGRVRQLPGKNYVRTF